MSSRTANSGASAGSPPPPAVRRASACGLIPDVDPKTHPYISTGLKENKFGVPVDDAVEIYRARTHAARHRDRRHRLPRRFSDHRDPALPGRARQAACAGRPVAGRRHRPASPRPGRRTGHPLPRRGAPGAGASTSRHCCSGSRGDRTRYCWSRARAGGQRRSAAHASRVPQARGGARNFAIVDAAMNDLIRPALYDAYHDIRPVRQRPGTGQRYEVVGPVCESGDFLGRDRCSRCTRGICLP